MSEAIQPRTAAEVLRAARDKIDRPKKWTQGWYSRDHRGEWVDLRSAACFCSVGALAYASGADDAQNFEEQPICEFFERANGIEYIATWNDDPSRTHAEVLAAFDKAIALAEASS